MVVCVVCGLPIVSGAAYTLWVATQGIYRRYIVIFFVINTGKYRNVYRDKYGKPKLTHTPPGCPLFVCRTQNKLFIRV